MKKGMSTFKKDTKWTLRKDSNLSFWHDRWSNAGTLRSIIHGPFMLGENRLRVKDVALDKGWDWSKISMEIPLPIKLETKAISYATTEAR